MQQSVKARAAPQQSKAAASDSQDPMKESLGLTEATKQPVQIPFRGAYAESTKSDFADRIRVGSAIPPSARRQPPDSAAYSTHGRYPYSFPTELHPSAKQPSAHDTSNSPCDLYDYDPLLEAYTFSTGPSQIRLEDALQQGKINELRAAFERAAFDAHVEASNSPRLY